MRERRLEFVLFLDTRKAFDSIDHDFIHAVVRKAGFPLWIQSIITALLFDAWVTPVVAEDTNGRIHIRRGVKHALSLRFFLFSATTPSCSVSKRLTSRLFSALLTILQLWPAS